MRYEAPLGIDARLTVVDVAGRVARTLVTGPGTGPRIVAWDGRDDSGHRLSSGVYFVRLDWAGARYARKVTVVR